MGRLRYTLSEAQAEAVRRAEAYVANLPGREKIQLFGATPDTCTPPSRASKHPVAWVVVYQLIPPKGGVIDGGELFVAVDLELGTVGIQEP